MKRLNGTMLAAVAVAGLLGAAGCTHPSWRQLGDEVEKFDLKSPEVTRDAVNRAKINYIDYYLSMRRRRNPLNPARFLKPPIIGGFTEFTVVYDWTFAYDREKKVMTGSYDFYKYLSLPFIEKFKETVVVMELPLDEFVRLAEEAVRDDWLDFVKKTDPEFKYEDVKYAAESIRASLLVHVYLTSVPTDVGKPMLPSLFYSAKNIPVVRPNAIKAMQVITGVDFGYRTDMTEEEVAPVLDKWETWLREKGHLKGTAPKGG